MKKLLLFVFLSVSCFGCEVVSFIKNNRKEAQATVLTGWQGKHTVPFRLLKNKVLVTVMLGNEEMTLQLDTGAPTAFSEKFARARHLIVDSSLFTASTPSGNKEITKYIACDQVLNIGGIKVLKRRLKVLALNNTTFDCEHIDGLLGADILSKFNLVFDFDSQTIDVYNKSELPADIDSYDQIIPFENYSPLQKIPVVALAINGYKMGFVWDMGFNNDFYLRFNAADKFDKLLKTFPHAEKYESTGAFTDANGDFPKTDIYYFNVDTISGKHFSAPHAYRASAIVDEQIKMPRCNIGIGFMKHYKMLISWQTNKIYLKEVSVPTPLQPMHLVNAGYAPKDSAIEVLLVALSSDAYKQGLRAGNKILSIDNSSAAAILNEYGYCDIHVAIQQYMKQATYINALINGKEQAILLK